MSEEEIIKYIENDIEIDTDTASWFEENNGIRKQIEKGIEAYKGILDLYNKEKEKNKELEKENLELHTEIANEVYWASSPAKQIEEHYISKDKIRELPRTEYCNAECLMNGIYVDWDYIKELLEE